VKTLNSSLLDTSWGVGKFANKALRDNLGWHTWVEETASYLGVSISDSDCALASTQVYSKMRKLHCMLGIFRTKSCINIW
jgi:hypothetical protein